VRDVFETGRRVEKGQHPNQKKKGPAEEFLEKSKGFWERLVTSEIREGGALVGKPSRTKGRRNTGGGGGGKKGFSISKAVWPPS